MLSRGGLLVSRVSSLYEAAPVDVLSHPDYLNAAVSGCWAESAYCLFRLCKGAEAQLDRDLSQVRAPRTLDVDIIGFDSMTVVSRDLVVPHPEAHRRRFVLEPVRELGQVGVCWPARVAEALAGPEALDNQEMTAVEGPEWAAGATGEAK